MNDLEPYNTSIGSLIEPEAISYSFNTLGWGIILGLLVILIIIVALWQYKRYLKNAYRRDAINRIKLLADEKESNIFYDINLILKSVALKFYERKQIACLYGNEWFLFLDSTLKIKTKNSNNYTEFTEAIYNNSYPIQNEKTRKNFISFASNWVKNHQI